MQKLNLSTLLTFVLLLTTSWAMSSCASAKPAAPAATHEAIEAPPNVSSPELNRIKALEGRWKSTTSMFGKKDEQVFTQYEITAGGAAVVETIFPGTPYEMMSVYFDDDNGNLAMTHYCMMRNRPHFALAKSDNEKIVMDVTKVEGLKSKDDPSMGAITLRFEDKDHFTTTCEGRGKGAEEHAPTTMRYTRVK